MVRKTFYLLLFILGLNGCSDQPMNNPYPEHSGNEKILYSSFSSSPKTLDPSKSYTSNEMVFTSQIYEPLFEYHYYKRPFELIPLTAVQMPKIVYYDKENNIVDENNQNNISHTEYTITIKKGIFFQPHPAFVKDNVNNYVYHNVPENVYEEMDIQTILDFRQVDTRELTAADYVYAIKRLAHPKVKSPIYGVMSKHIEGFEEFGEILESYDKKNNSYQVLLESNIDGVKVVDRYSFKIRIKNIYPQFLYWLSMNFFAPMPWEGDVFYNNSYLLDNNISFDWYPIGTGPYMLTINNPNGVMELVKNPNYRKASFFINYNTTENIPIDVAIPIIDKAIYILEKETIPRWTKFMQGYYDFSSISSDSFDEAIKINAKNEVELTDKMQEKNIKLYSSVSPSIFYIGFNMLDDVVGKGESARLLRHAISVAIDYKEYIKIFLNGRGILATSPIPPSVLNIDSLPEHGRNKNNNNVLDAKQMLIDAGYANGIDPVTNRPLIINLDVPSGAGADDKERFNWYRKQLGKIGIVLNIRATHYNRFQDKLNSGDVQLFLSGWHADYPDPENFLFLLYSINGRIKSGGENYSNYHNKEFDSLFAKMQKTTSTHDKMVLIHKILKILDHDVPWVWGYHPKSLILSHSWNSSFIPSEISYNTLKYRDVDVEMRKNMRRLWNKPNWIGLLIILGAILFPVIPVYLIYKRKRSSPKYKVIK